MLNHHIILYDQLNCTSVLRKIWSSKMDLSFSRLKFRSYKQKMQLLAKVVCNIFMYINTIKTLQSYWYTLRVDLVILISGRVGNALSVL